MIILLTYRSGIPLLWSNNLTIISDVNNGKRSNFNQYCITFFKCCSYKLGSIINLLSWGFYISWTWLLTLYIYIMIYILYNMPTCFLPYFYFIFFLFLNLLSISVLMIIENMVGIYQLMPYLVVYQILKILVWEII